jgi:hypothetical protein
VRGDLIGTANRPVVISAIGQLQPGPDTDLAIGSVKVGGNVSNAKILAGFNLTALPVNEDAQIGIVKVGGDWVGSSIAAGVDDGADNLVGTNDDTLFDEGGSGDPNIVARIGKISIGGTADGTASGSDGFGFVAEEIGSLSIDGVFIALTSGKANDDTALGTTGDFNLKEV